MTTTQSRFAGCLFVLFATASCGGARHDEATAQPTNSGNEAASAAPAEPVASAAPATPAVPAFSATPSLDGVSAEAIHGSLNNIEVAAAEVTLQNQGGHWSLHLSRPTPYFEITLPLHEAPRAGARQGSTAPETPGIATAGALQVPHPTLSAVSWNSEQVGWSLEITTLNARPCPRRVTADRDVGTASGHVVIATHDAHGEHPDGYLAGTFDGTTVRCLATH